jgi:hypothetical protein
VSRNVVVLRLFLNSLEFERVHNFPQHGLQFVAEVGGLMAFFLGVSIVSVLECVCYGCGCAGRTCCPGCCGCCDEQQQAQDPGHQVQVGRQQSQVKAIEQSDRAVYFL